MRWNLNSSAPSSHAMEISMYYTTPSEESESMNSPYGDYSNTYVSLEGNVMDAYVAQACVRTREWVVATDGGREHSMRTASTSNEWRGKHTLAFVRQPLSILHSQPSWYIGHNQARTYQYMRQSNVHSDMYVLYVFLIWHECSKSVYSAFVIVRSPKLLFKHISADANRKTPSPIYIQSRYIRLQSNPPRPSIQCLWLLRN